jgi:hypothetical protein
MEFQPERFASCSTNVESATAAGGGGDDDKILQRLEVLTAVVMKSCHLP